MKTSMLHSIVSRITGESIATVKRLGFREKKRRQQDLPASDNPPVAVIDCPCCGGTVVLAWNREDPLPEFAECRRCETATPYWDNEVYEIDLLEVESPTPLAYAPAA